MSSDVSNHSLEVCCDALWAAQHRYKSLAGPVAEPADSRRLCRNHPQIGDWGLYVAKYCKHTVSVDRLPVEQASTG